MSHASEQAGHRAVDVAIVATLALGLVVEALTKLGYAEWIIYFVPLMLCVYTPRPGLPLLVAGAITLLLPVGYFISPPGIEPRMVIINRMLDVLAVWAFALVIRHTIRVRIALERQEWLRSGQMQVTARILEPQSVEKLAEGVLEGLAGYLGASVGALYKVEDDGRLAWKAGYAWPDAEGTRDLAFASGEGLVGQAARRGEPLVVTDLPAGHLRLRSGVAEGGPAALLLAPTRADGVVNGVIELAFLRPVSARSVELLHRLADPVGLALRTARLRADRERLLAQTRRQAEDLQAQQERLRVANEELEEQGETLRHSQVRLESQQAELEQINSELEEQAQALERHNEALAEARSDIATKAAALEDANRYKSEFLANMSHELRTPLNSTLILAKLLAENRGGNLTEEQVRFARTIHAAGHDLLELVDDVLDLSKIEARRLEVTREHVELAGLLETLAEAFRPLAEQKGLALEMAVEPGAATQLHTDGQRLRQILRNLLSNAVKFTERGSVSLHVRAAGPGRLEFAVRDTGIGVDPRQQDAIFEPFRQADGATHRRFGGTGLGLSISRELATLLGGRIDLDSTPGAGSVFTLTIPAELPRPGSRPGPDVPASTAPDATAHAARRPSALATDSPSLPVPAATGASPGIAPAASPHAGADAPRGVLLVVEDDPVFAEILAGIARERGYAHLIAATADEAVDLALAHRPTAILLDVKLPDHSGLAVLDRLKRDPSTRHIPVQVITGLDARESALGLGAAGVMRKPVRREEVLAAIAGLESVLAQRVRTVLIVEDDPVQADALRELLGTGDVRTVSVSTAREALERLEGPAGCDCMVLDLTLPDATGFEVLEQLAARGPAAVPPVIVYTSRRLGPEEEQRLRRHARSVIVKGARSAERLLDEVTLFLHRLESSLPPEQQRMLRDARGNRRAFEGRRVLLVEDDVRNVFALTRALEPQGAHVQIARNGVEALAALGDGPGPDLVLMDVMMPEMDGLEATRRIRAEARFATLPIIALTAKAMPEDRERCLAAGANDYVTKPIDVEKLLSLARIWMQH